MGGSPESGRLNGPGDLAAPAIGAAASLAFFASPWFIPVLGMFFSSFASAPLVLVYRRKGVKAGRVGVLLGLGVSLALFQLSLDSFGGVYFLYYAATAAALGETWEMGIREDWAVALAGLASSLCLLVLFWSAGLFSGMEMEAVWRARWEQELSMVLSAYQHTGLEPSQAAALKKEILAVVRILFKLAPAILAGVTLLLAWLNLLVVRVLTPALAPQSVPYLGRLNTFRAPFWMVWVLIGAAVVTMLAPGRLSWLGQNVLVLVGVVYFFQGLAVVAHFFERKRVPRFIRVIAYVFLVVELRLALLLALAGLFDTWFNFRRLGREKAA